MAEPLRVPPYLSEAIEKPGPLQIYGNTPQAFDFVGYAVRTMVRTA